jgi:hypothetical protein
MSDTVLWVLAVGVGVVGFLFLFVAAGVALFLRSEDRDLGVGSATPPPAAGRAGAPEPPSTPPPSEGQPPPSVSEYPEPPASPRAAGGLWAWIKAWIFASVHAVTVSLVLGAVTFFEDLARASDEIQHTGTVTFPKRLMPGATVQQPAPPRRLSEPVSPVEDVDPADIELSDPGDWEIVDFVQEPSSTERGS